LRNDGRFRGTGARDGWIAIGWTGCSNGLVRVMSDPVDVVNGWQNAHMVCLRPQDRIGKAKMERVGCGCDEAWYDQAA